MTTQKYEDKNATVKIKLYADSKYTSEIEARISPNQWGKIVEIIEEGDTLAQSGTKQDKILSICGCGNPKVKHSCCNCSGEIKYS